MIKIVNYLDIPDENKDDVLNQLYQVGFCTRNGNKRILKTEMDKSQKEKMPQFIFVFRDNVLIGYMFLIAEKENYCKVFPWWAVDNSDELPLDVAIQLLEYGILLSTKCNCLKLTYRLNIQLENQKKGIGRRTESDCR